MRLVYHKNCSLCLKAKEEADIEIKKEIQTDSTPLETPVTADFTDIPASSSQSKPSPKPKGRKENKNVMKRKEIYYSLFIFFLFLQSSQLGLNHQRL
jgi:hypothetical protein